MTRPFREHHLLQMLNSYQPTLEPLDRFLYQYFRHHKALGSKDRKWVADAMYGLVRWKATLDALAPHASWEEKLALFQQKDLSSLAHEKKFPMHLQLSLPLFLYQELLDQYGEEKTHELARLCNEPAPVTIRANRLKISREELLQRWKSVYSVTPCLHSAEGIRFEKRLPLTSLPEFHQGYFEMQDEGSQCVAQLVDAKPGDQVLDYCAGSGGKSLAFAPRMEGKGQIYLHDIRRPVFDEMRRRLRRAGVQNAQVLLPENAKEKRWKQSMDWVLADVPCSGTGTLRRNPDLKWKLDADTLLRLVSEQRVIFEKALRFVRPGGCIVYVTCSILSKENQQQVQHFLKIYPLSLIKEWSSLPISGGMDGFYGAVLQKNS